MRRHYDRMDIESRRPRPRILDEVDDDYMDDEVRGRRSLKDKWDDIDWDIAPDDADEEAGVAINVFGYFFVVCGIVGVFGHIIGIGG